ncbi:B-cell receptor CD22-like isoform X2 [Clupea harengus]|uniref:B-cell receptor CD22-like isoform X2 n=1 Tax=Clupea harengus TaxID=7950 RepID=A0A6P8ENC3_CLUHA|nr:B-cell receptor CD22-like isoform X2 [Clupea harengus]
MGLLLVMMSCVTSLSVVILLTNQGVCDEEWSVTYRPESTCAFVGDSVTMSCSYTHPSDLTITEVYWTKQLANDTLPIHEDPEYSNRISEDCKQGNKRCNLRIDSLTKLDFGEYYCRITTSYVGQNWTGRPGIYLDVKDPPQTSVSISPHGNIQEGTDVTLTCTSTSDLPVRSYSWHKTGSRGAQGTGKTYTIKHITPEDIGQYYSISKYECGFLFSSTHLQVLYSPKHTTVFTTPSGVITKGSSVTLTCSSDANPTVENYTWFKVNESTPVGSGQQYSITNISSEDGGQYYCEAKNTYGAEDSTAVSIMEGISDGGQYYCETRNTYGVGNSSIVSVIVEAGEQSPAMTAVITVSVCGLLGLFCGVFWLSKKCKKEMLAKGRNEQDAGDSVGNTQTENPNTIQMTSAGQSLKTNTMQPDAVYQGLDPNTIQPDAVYQGLDPNTTQPDAVYQNLNPNTTKPDAVYQGLDPNTIQPDAVYQSLNPNTTQPDAVYQSLDPNTTQPDAVYQSLNPNTNQPDAVYQSLNPNTT